MRNIEQRKQLHFETNTKLEVRAKDGEAKKIVGYASVFNQITNIGYFDERVAPGAFTRSLTERPDVRALWDHDSSFPIGRVGAGSLELKEDGTGLYVEITPPDTQAGRDTLELVRTGHITGMSFGFMPMPDGADWSIVEGREVRTLTDVDLFEISVVTFPAYEGTSAEARSATLSPKLSGTFVEPASIFEVRSNELKASREAKLVRQNDGLKKRIAWLEKSK